MLLTKTRPGLGLTTIRPTSYPLYRGIVPRIGGVLRRPQKFIPFHTGSQLSDRTIINAPGKSEVVAVEPEAVPDMRTIDEPPLLNRPPTKNETVPKSSTEDVSPNFKPLKLGEKQKSFLAGHEDNKVPKKSGPRKRRANRNLSASVSANKLKILKTDKKTNKSGSRK